MMNCRPPQTVRGPRRIAFAPALRGKAPRFRVRSAAFFARRLRRFFQVIFSKGTYNRKWYIVGRRAVLPRAGHLLDPVAPAAASPHPVGAGGLGGPISFSSERNGGKNAAKNQWFLEFLSSDCSCGAKRFRSESPLRLPSLPLTWHAESNGRPPVWAIIKSRTCRQRRQV